MIPSRTRTAPAVTRLDDDIATAATAGEALAAVAQALELALGAVESWRLDAARLGCLCPTAAHLRTALAAVADLTPPRLRGPAERPGPAEPGLVHAFGGIARVLGRAARILDALAQLGHPQPTRPGLLGAVLDADRRARCRAAWADTFHALVAVRAVQEAETWSGTSAKDPWLLLAADSPAHPPCTDCTPPGKAADPPPAAPAPEDAAILPFPRRPAHHPGPRPTPAS
ncbi:hypothetical protein [Yinghuangia soli]|uniref:Uncharacterized protein n=1 Tax=Yinghuangia soli TaxID=2908204 RepID=A0AA41U1Q1_9ACTN|nr:hypothetical protein [Yinghuangia soli]MCF2526349.1 hypothetical protein [Yinghuangia soli]